MKIAIGGMARSGTNSTAMFLHLHPETKVYFTGPSHDVERWEEGTLWDKTEHINLQTVQGLEEEDHKKFIELVKEATNGPIIVRRADQIEDRCFDLARYGKDLKFVYCIRKNPFDVFISHCCVGGEETYEKNNKGESFVDFWIQNAFKSLIHINFIQNPKFIFCINEPDWKGLSKFLGLSVTLDQTWFTIKKPRVGAFSDKKKRDRFVEKYKGLRLPDVLIKQWSDVLKMGKTQA